MAAADARLAARCSVLRKRSVAAQSPHSATQPPWWQHASRQAQCPHACLLLAAPPRGLCCGRAAFDRTLTCCSAGGDTRVSLALTCYSASSRNVAVRDRRYTITDAQQCCMHKKNCQQGAQVDTKAARRREGERDRARARGRAKRQLRGSDASFWQHGGVIVTPGYPLGTPP